MRAVRLVAAVDEYAIEPGLKLADVPNMDGMAVERTDGVLIAHDLLEHQNGLHNIGTVWDELEALGGIWQVRGRTGDMFVQNIHTPQVNVASDVTRMYADWLDEPRRHFKRTRACDYDEDFQDIINIARSDIPSEHSHLEGGVNRASMERYLDEAFHRMRSGFRKAQRRFGSDYRGYDLFRAVAEASARAAKYIDFEGQEFTLRYGGNEAIITERRMEDW